MISVKKLRSAKLTTLANGDGSNMHNDIFARRVKYSQRDTFARKVIFHESKKNYNMRKKNKKK